MLRQAQQEEEIFFRTTQFIRAHYLDYLIKLVKSLLWL